MSLDKVSLRKRGTTPTPLEGYYGTKSHRVGPDGYDVLIDGEVVGIVLRHVQIDTGAKRGGRRWVLWSVHATDGRDYDPHGAYETRQEAVAEVIRRAAPPLKETGPVGPGEAST